MLPAPDRTKWTLSVRFCALGLTPTRANFLNFWGTRMTTDGAG
jgi:hypothetical protein